MKKNSCMKPQDIVILVFLCTEKEVQVKVKDLSEALNISLSEISESLARSSTARLIDFKKKDVFKKSLLEFIQFGLKFVFPAVPGSLTRGIPTAHSAPPLSEKIVQGSEHYVWPHPGGKSRGVSIEPLFRTVPDVALKYPNFYETMALIDTLRVGKVREINLAIPLLGERINPDVK